MSLPKRDGVNGRYYLIHKPDVNPEVLEHADQCIQDVLDGTAEENHSGYPVVVRNQNGTPFLPSQLLERYLSKLPLKGFLYEEAVVFCDALRRLAGWKEIDHTLGQYIEHQVQERYFEVGEKEDFFSVYPPCTVWPELRSEDVDDGLLRFACYVAVCYTVYGASYDSLTTEHILGLVSQLRPDMVKELKTNGSGKLPPNIQRRKTKHLIASANRIFTGRFVRGGKSSQVIEALKIVEDSEFEEAQKIVAARQGERQERMNIAYTTRGASLLSGNIFCAHCGAKLYAITYSDPVTLADGTKKKYKGIKYVCSKRIHKRGPCDGQTQYASKKIDGVVLEAVHAVLQKMQGSVKDESLKKSYEKTLKSKKSIYAELLREQAKEQEKLNRLLAEVGNVLMNESSFSLETLNRAIELTKTKLAEFDEKIPKALKELNEQKSVLEHLDTYYDQFKGWAESFDASTNEEKKMIICKLISRIEVGRGYNVNIVLNMDYGQFVGE